MRRKSKFYLYLFFYLLFMLGLSLILYSGFCWNEIQQPSVIISLGAVTFIGAMIGLVILWSSDADI